MPSLRTERSGSENRTISIRPSVTWAHAEISGGSVMPWPFATIWMMVARLEAQKSDEDALWPGRVQQAEGRPCR